MLKIKKIVRIIITIIAVILVIIIVNTKIYLNNNQNIDIVKNDDKLVKNEEESLEETICVIDIKGAVQNPGVYTTSCTDNVSDVIRLAGGLTENADTSVTNLAKKVTNEMVIIIYTAEEVKNSNIVDTVVKVVEQECICPNIQNDGCINDEITDTIGNKLININTASVEELKKLPGIGEAKAKAIIEYRQSHGDFRTIEDIQNVNGIGNSLYEEIKVYITT